MTTTTVRQSSLDKVLDKARANGWLIDIDETTAKVPDPEKVYSRNWDGRPRVLGKKTVRAIAVRLDNDTGATYGKGAGTVTFDLDGRFISGTYGYGSVKDALRTLDGQAPDVVRERVDQRRAETLQRYQEQAAQAEAERVEASRALTVKQSDAFGLLTGAAVGLTDDQATQVLILLQDQHGNSLTGLVWVAEQARHAEERAERAQRAAREYERGERDY